MKIRCLKIYFVFLFGFLGIIQLKSQTVNTSFFNEIEKCNIVAGFSKGINGSEITSQTFFAEDSKAYQIENKENRNSASWLSGLLTVQKKQKQVLALAVSFSGKTGNNAFAFIVNSGDTIYFENNGDSIQYFQGENNFNLTFYKLSGRNNGRTDGILFLHIPENYIAQKQPVCSIQNNQPENEKAWLRVFHSSVQSGVTFENVPVLLKDGTQRIKANSIYLTQPGEVKFTIDGQLIQRFNLSFGFNQSEISVPKVTKPTQLSIQVEYRTGKIEKYKFTVVPVRKWEMNLVQHSHTDIGYTRPQSEILAEQMRYIDYALDYCEKTDTFPDDSKFRWTCESAWVTREYLHCRPTEQIERLKKRIGEGRIEVTGMFFNMAEISDENIMFDFLQPLHIFREMNIPVQTAMQNDVNGIAWCMPDYFKNTGVKYLDMGINETRSIRPFDKPTCFWWESPAGERLLAFRSDHYMQGNSFGLPFSKDFSDERLLDYLQSLENCAYPFDKIAVQFSGYRTDNAPPSTGSCEIVRQWNQKYEYPKLRLAVAKEFFEYVEKNHKNELPVFRNAWLDWWTDGYGSTSRETAEVRKVQNLKQVDEGIFAMVAMLGGELSSDLQQKMDHISENALFFDEHTCGASESISDPYSINSERQWLQKGAYAWEALKRVTLLNEDALGRIQQYFKKASFPLIYVVNSLGWNRSETVELFIDYEILPLGKDFSIVDLETGEKVPVQFLHGRSEGAYWNLEVSNVPALGFKALKIDVSETIKMEPNNLKNENISVLENEYYKIAIEKNTGGIIELFDKEFQENIYDSGNSYSIGQPVRETLPTRDEMNPSHSTVTNVKVEKGVSGDVYNSIKIAADLEGFSKGEPGVPKGILWEIKLFNHSKKIEFSYQATKEIITAPEALYVAFPFLMPDSRIVFETIGGSLTQGEQLSGSSSDWNVAQNFVSVKGKKGQIIMVSNEIPLWQFSDFNMGKFERNPTAGKPWLYSWVMNNYWFTNFRAFQEGTFNWTYQLTTLRDTSVSAATKFAWSARNSFATRTFPEGKNDFTEATAKTLETTGAPNVILINSRPSVSGNGCILLHFREVDGMSGQIQLNSKISGRPIKYLKEVNVLGEEIGSVSKNIDFNPYQVKFIEVGF